ncbi:glycosyltransferase family 2 protein [Halostagnicola kamekurae]|uniref:Glycosyl transferase family 2 n=1 Tax=Halostagnicola kamekurae TaxID=619731 RepID=A0A1I6QLY4_9EURY|nr:glycosyltransferase [Halostagnicola kamekurae]SFS53453.1 Glycosyl transferase family 2 [Halostagnicola kamekurae]
MTRVSVIIPTYNRAETLPRAIDSALEQTVEDLEVVVVDDGSTDDTSAVLAAYDDPRVRPVVHATNQGANAARNTGIDHANGEYVAFLDSDDTWLPAKLERQLGALEGRSSEWVGVYCDSRFELSGTDGRLRTTAASVLATRDETPTLEGDDELIGEILADNVQPGAGSTLLVRTTVADEVGGFSEELDRFQDPEFCISVLKQGKLAYVDEPLVVREETGHPPASVVHAASDQYLEMHEETVDRYEDRGFEIRASHDLIVAKRYFADGKPLRGLWHLRTASASPRNYPGLCWAAGAGLRRNPLPVVTTVLGGLVLAAVAGRTLRSRRRLE